MDEEVESAFARCLTADLDVLIPPEEPSTRGGVNVASWDLPGQDKQALARWGIPIIEAGMSFARIRLWGEVQEGAQPEIHSHGSAAYRQGNFFQ